MHCSSMYRKDYRKYFVVDESGDANERAAPQPAAAIGTGATDGGARAGPACSGGRYTIRCGAFAVEVGDGADDATLRQLLRAPREC